jgi:EmrB/QacA subfamily drug resistance transporter
MVLDHAGRLHHHHHDRTVVASTDTPGAAEADGISERRRTTALAIVCLCAFVAAVDITITDVTLPFIADDLHADTSDLQWVVDAYNIVLAGLLLFGGGLADRYGRKRVFLMGFALFGIGCLVAAFSSSVGMLVAARGVMGIGAAGVIAPALAILAGLYPPERRAPAVAAWAVFGAAGLAAGPIIGGLLLDSFWWGSTFLVNVPVVVVGVIVGAWAIPESRKPGATRLDVVGAVLSVAGLGLVLAGVIEGPGRGWDDPLVVASLVLGALVCVAFIRWELHTDDPMFDVRIALRPVVAAGATALAISYVCFTGMLFLLPQYLQYVQDRGVIAVGLGLVPFAVAFGVLSLYAPRMLLRFGGRATLVTGLLLLALGNGVLALLPESSGWWIVLGGTVVVGLGLSFLIAPASTILMNDLPPERAGDGSSFSMLARLGAAAAGVAILGSIFAMVYAGHLDDATRDLSSEQRTTVEQSVEGAVDVADTVGPSERDALLTAADNAFDAGAQVAFVVAALLSLGGAFMASRALRPRAARPTVAPNTAPDPAGA